MRGDIQVTRPSGRTARSVDAWEALFRAYVAVHGRLEASGSYGELAPREYDLLLHLGRGPTDGMRQRDLLDRVLLPQPSVSRLLAGLEERGLVAIAPAPGDKRGKRIALTDEGRRVQRASGRLHVAELRRVLAGLTDAELDALRTLSARLEDAARPEG